MEKRLYNYIMRPAMIFFLDIWNNFNLFKWLRCFIQFMDANKTSISNNFVHSYHEYLGKMSFTIKK